jgi:exosortase family protein XrtF
MWKEFKPAIRFVALFVGIYLVGNIIYGLYISSRGNAPDHITKLVAHQAAGVLNLADFVVSTEVNPDGPTVFMKSGARIVLNVYEGCNGINVFIVFVSFLVAFGGPVKKYLWFVPVGVLILHVCNLLRIILLYGVAIGYQHYFYYVHKYIFTGIIYLVVLALWIYWIRKGNDKRKIASAN